MLYLFSEIELLKRLITIFFLCIYLFTVVGYRGVFNLFDQSISEAMISQLDKGEYNDAELVELKIPYPMLYTNSSVDYERYDGELEMNGVHYNYVKRKISNDTLYLLCIPNRQKTQLAAAQIDYLKNTSDAANPSGSKKSPSSDAAHKALNWEHHNLIAHFNLAAPAVSITAAYSPAEFKLPGAYILAPFQPPKI